MKFYSFEITAKNCGRETGLVKAASLKGATKKALSHWQAWWEREMTGITITELGKEHGKK